MEKQMKITDLFPLNNVFWFWGKYYVDPDWNMYSTRKGPEPVIIGAGQDKIKLNGSITTRNRIRDLIYSTAGKLWKDYEDYVAKQKAEKQLNVVETVVQPAQTSTSWQWTFIQLDDEGRPSACVNEVSHDYDEIKRVMAKYANNNPGVTYAAVEIGAQVVNPGPVWK
jgi:hypothetical protein